MHRRPKVGRQRGGGPGWKRAGGSRLEESGGGGSSEDFLVWLAYLTKAIVIIVPNFDFD